MQSTIRKLGYKVENLNKKVTDATEDEVLSIMNLLDIHGVICIPNQDLDGHELFKFLNLLGCSLEYPDYVLEDNYQEYSEIYGINRVGNVRKDGTVNTEHV